MKLGMRDLDARGLDVICLRSELVRLDATVEDEIGAEMSFEDMSWSMRPDRAVLSCGSIVMNGRCDIWESVVGVVAQSHVKMM